MSNVFFTADTHFFHRSITEFCPHSRGGFALCEEMSEQLITNWNNQVGPRDVVYLLGDFCFGGLERLQETIPRLQGSIHLILGNHDHHAEKKPTIASQFKSVQHYLAKKVCGQFIVMFHYPIYSWVHMEHGSWHLHGHVHDDHVPVPGKIMNVGIDTRTDMKLYSFDEVKEFMADKPVRYRHADMEGR